jgi:peroxiredoxin Q/BCP
MLTIGDQAPDFELADDQGRPRRLSRELAAGPVALYFYPADFTPVCTRQACMFRDRGDELARVGVRVLGVSPQGSQRHAAFRGRHRLPFSLLADPERLVIERYGARGMLGTRRISYLIGTDGVIEDVCRAAFRLSAHRAFVARAIARYDAR